MKENIKVSEVNIIPVKPSAGLVAFASCVINQSIYIGNIAQYTSFSRPEGYRLVYPSKILPTGKKINCVHPITKSAGKIISKEIIDEYITLQRKIINENT